MASRSEDLSDTVASLTCRVDASHKLCLEELEKLFEEIEDELEYTEGMLNLNNDLVTQMASMHVGKRQRHSPLLDEDCLSLISGCRDELENLVLVVSDMYGFSPRRLPTKKFKAITDFS